MFLASFWFFSMPPTCKSSIPSTANSRASRVVVWCNQSRRTLETRACKRAIRFASVVAAPASSGCCHRESLCRWASSAFGPGSFSPLDSVAAVLTPRSTAYGRLALADSLGQLNLDGDGDKPAVSDAPDRGRERFAGEAQFFAELHPVHDRQTHSLAGKRKGAGAIVEAGRIAHAFLLELRIAALLLEVSPLISAPPSTTKRRP